MTCMKQEFCIHEKYCQRHIGQNFDSCILFSRNSKPMTNEEWLCQLTTEEKAKWIAEEKMCRGYFIFPSMEEAIQDALEWLKQPHGGES